MREESSTLENRPAAVELRTPWRVQQLDVLPGHRLRVRFRDGLEGVVDMSVLVSAGNAGVFAALAEPAQFAQAYLEHGVPTWPGEIDIAPDAAYSAILSIEDRIFRLGDAG